MVVACVIAIAVLLGGVVTIEPLRDRVWGIVTKWYNDCFEIVFDVDREDENY